MRPPKLRLGLRLKIIAYISLVVILTATVLGWFLISRETERLASQLEEKGKVFARNVASASEYGVLTGDERIFKNIIDGLMREKDVAYCIIYDSAGRPLANTPTLPHEIPGVSPSAAYKVNENALKTDETLTQAFTKDIRKTPVYDIAEPIVTHKARDLSGEELMFGLDESRPQSVITEKIGVARIGISLDSMNKAIEETRLTTLQVTVLVILFAIIGATIFLVRLIVDPVQQLVAATERVAYGDLDKPVEISTNDEIGELGFSFNKMTKDLKRYRTEIEKHSRTLEQTVHERTKALRLMNEELYKTNYELEKVSEHKSQFLANMSHELRTPLNAIIGFSEILFDQSFGELNEKQSSYAENVVVSGKHLLQLINEILDLAKIESGKMNLQLETFSVASAISEIMDLARGLAVKKEISIRQHLSPTLISLTADRNKFKQIFYNLISNAIKFTPSGGLIEVTTDIVGDFELADDENPVLKRNAEFCVKDSGIGIDKADQERIFQEFQQVDGSYSREHEGTGLGLALTRKLVELHGGSIWLESEKDKGSTFYFTIPLSEKDQEEVGGKTDEAHPVEVTESPPEEDRSQKIILVVEDDQQSFELISTYLSEAGYSIVHAATGQEALRAAFSTQPSIIALDIILPDMDGWSVLQRLKAAPETSHIPVVITSVLQDEETAFGLGAADYMTKPISRGELLRRMERLCAVSARDLISNILVIDADKDFVDTLHAILERESFCVERAYTGLQGIEVASREKPDLVFLDLMLPDISGFEIVEFLRMNGPTKDIPIIILTGKDLTDEEKALLNGKVEASARKGHHDKNDFLKEIKRVERLAAAKKGER